MVHVDVPSLVVIRLQVLKVSIIEVLERGVRD